MMRVVKRALKGIIRSTMSIAVGGQTSFATGRYLFDEMINAALRQTRHVRHDGIDLVFAAPNSFSRARADSFASKEPETLEWIAKMERGSVLWDIGANVGIYSCYAAKHRACEVFAFEPSVFNLELLARNVFLNGLVASVTIVPLPLSERLTTSEMHLSMTEWGGAMSTFGESFTHDGTPLKEVFGFRTIGLSMDDAVSRLGIPQPDYIKMDVDGIEHLILAGGPDVLAKVRGVLVEVNDEFAEQAGRAAAHLATAGLTLAEKRQAEMFAHTRVYNQIWER